MRKWATSAPEWLQVRLVELPGHGYLSNVDDNESSCMPLCANRQTSPFSRTQLEKQRFEWIRSLARQIEPLLYRNDGTFAPCAFYGFSFGALLAYELLLELQRKFPSRSTPLVALFACGRGAPHAVVYRDSFFAKPTNRRE